MIKEEEIKSIYNELLSSAKPSGATIGALIGAVPAVARYDAFVHLNAILYVFILIPALIIGVAAQFTGRAYRIKHQLLVGIIACFVHLACVYYFNYRIIFYFFLPMVFATALITSRRFLTRDQSIVVDMESEGRLKQHEKPSS